MIVKEDCFACHVNGIGKSTCVALKAIDCLNCSFYKTRKEFWEGLEKYPPTSISFMTKREAEVWMNKQKY